HSRLFENFLNRQPIVYSIESSTIFGSVTLSSRCASIALLMAKLAPSFLAQLRREIPLFTSHNSIDCNRLGESSVPSSTIPMPPLITSPPPTPPPLCMETQVAPRKLSPITL